MIKKLHYGMVVKDEYGEEFVVGKYNKSFDIDANSYKVLLTSELHKVALYSSDLISLLNEGRYSLITDMKDKTWWWVKGWDRYISKYRPSHGREGAPIWKRWTNALNRYGNKKS